MASFSCLRRFRLMRPSLREELGTGGEEGEEREREGLKYGIKVCRDIMAGKTCFDEIRNTHAGMNGQPDILFAASTSPSPSAKWALQEVALRTAVSLWRNRSCAYPRVCVSDTCAGLRYFPSYVTADDIRQCKNTGNKEWTTFLLRNELFTFSVGEGGGACIYYYLRTVLRDETQEV